MDISKLMNMHDFALETKSIGLIQCGSIDVKTHSILKAALKSGQVEGSVLARRLVGLVAKRAPTPDLNESSQASGNDLTAEEIGSLCNEDIELFVQEFIAHNKWLLHSYEDAERRVSTDKEGRKSVSYAPKATDLPKGGAESNSDYLVRVLRYYFGEQEKSRKRMMSRLLGNAGAAQQSIAAIIAKEHQNFAQYAAANAAESIFKRDQEFLRTIDPFRDLRKNAGLDAGVLQFKFDQGFAGVADNQFKEIQQYLDQSPTSVMLAKAIYEREDLAREIARGLIQVDSISAVVAAGLARQEHEARDLLKIHESMFRLPRELETSSLLDSYRIGGLAEFAELHAKSASDRQRTIDAITTPWLHVTDTSRSVSAILELQGMGNALRASQGFDLGLTAALRLDLGDWRDKISFSESVFVNPVARIDFYVARGFNIALTDFPEAAFRQSLELAGLDGKTIDLDLDGMVVQPSVDSAEEAGLRRTNKCHDQLQRFERRLRQFIDAAMTSQYGVDWPRKQLDPKLYEKWELKKQQAANNGVMVAFIDVADFTDYETIICKKDHWREIFEARFKRKESVRESFQRLHPIRLATMHARIVTKEDEIYLVAEVVRIVSAIK